MESKRALALTIVTLIAIASYHFTCRTLSTDERSTLFVLVLAAGLWTTEAVPLVATSILIPILQSLLGIQSFKKALSPFFDPVVMLLLGGFLLAIAVEKRDLDEYIVYQIVSRVGVDARIVVLVFMMTTAFLSMWISNTASTALMVSIAMKLTDGVMNDVDNFKKIMVLSMAYSATAGGLATLVGTTTCAMAAGALKDIVGYEITFLGWMFFGLPITFIMILAIWVVLFVIFPTDLNSINLHGVEKEALNGKQMLTLVVFALSILLWITGKLPEPISLAIGWPGHGMSSSVVAAIIAFLLLFLGLINERDLPRANWNTLLLIGGGLSLGLAMEASGLVTRISDGLFLFTRGASEPVTIMFVVAFGLGISAFASNTASAGILLPIAIGLGDTGGISPVILAVVVGFATSLDFMLPVGTPPNAIAYSTGVVKMREMIKVGVVLDVIGLIITVILALFLWPLLI